TTGLRVDELQRLRGNVAHLSEIATDEHLFGLFTYCHGADRRAHPIDGDHRVRDLRRLGQVAFDACGQHPEDVVLGSSPGHRRDKAHDEVEVAEKHLVARRVDGGTTATATAGDDRELLQRRLVSDRAGDDRVAGLVDGYAPQLVLRQQMALPRGTG